MKKLYISLLMIQAVILNTAYAIETVYVSSNRAKIYKEASFSSELITTLKRNEKIDVLNHKGRWIQVSHIKMSGWISRYSVTSSKPFTEKVSILNRIRSFFGNNKRNRLVLVSTAGGIRGLSKDRLDSLNKKDFDAVEKMENIEISEEELNIFMVGNTK